MKPSKPISRDLLINDTIVNSIQNPITSDKLVIPNPMNIDTLKYIFYTSLKLFHIGFGLCYS